MAARSATQNIVTLTVLASLALLAAAPSAAAQTDEGTKEIACNPTPLGQPGGGAVGQAKAAGNTIIYTGCTLALGVLGPVLVIADAAIDLAIQLAGGAITLVVGVVNEVCIFVFGAPCTVVTPTPDQ